MSTLTQSQQKAIDFKHHLAVTASAGSGKTTVLVQRYVEILLQTDTRVNEIVAITFTEKAASELKKRIARLVEAKLRAAKETTPLLQRLEQIRDQLSSANIGTIHSFCAKLLREHPVESGVDAMFTVVEDIDKGLLIKQSIQEALEAAIASDSESVEKQDTVYALRMLGKFEVEKYLTAFFSKREEISQWLGSHHALNDGESPDDLIERWNRKIEQWLVHRLDEQDWRHAVVRLVKIAEGKSTPEVRASMAKWNAALSANEKILLVKEVLEKILTKTKGSVQKDFVGRKVDRESYRHEEVILQQLHFAIAGVLTAYADARCIAGNRTMLRLTRILLGVYGNALARYDEKKLQQGKLDFEDLQVKALQLLQREEIRAKLSSMYKYIMVDEYQDTNRLQDDILRRLVEEFEKGNLFIVGDPKQSIYGFRHARVEIFEKAKEDIGRQAAGEGTSHVLLPESFRLLVGIVDFVNRVFSRAMTEGTSEFDVTYDELVKGRTNDAEGKVELLLVRSRIEPEEEAADESEEPDLLGEECNLIARRIAALIESKFEIFVPERDRGSRIELAKPVEFRDVAILPRSRTHVNRLVRALEAHGVPYIISSGVGFYQTQEILDFFNYLKFLLNSGDDVALAGLLRSPFFAISDAELFGISLQKHCESFWEKTQRCIEQSNSTKHLRYAVEVLKDNLNLANRLPIPELVDRFFRQTGWYGVIAGMPFGEQRIANVKKLLRFAREFEARGLTNLFDFVERLKTLVELEQKEGQASIDSQGNAVRILTIHAAKGLEFPVVFVPFAHRRFQFDKELFVDSSLGIGFKVRDENDMNEEVEPSFYRFLKQRSHLQTEAEEKRVFYVACTRARDMLVISGQLAEQKSPSFLKWTLEGLALLPESLNPGQANLPERLVNMLRRHQDAYTAESVQHKLSIDVITAREQIPFSGKEFRPAGLVTKMCKMLIEPLQGQTRGEFFSATQLQTFLECPTKYYLKYGLGIPEEKTTPYNFDEDEESNDRILGELEGSLTHAVFEHLIDKNDSEAELRKRAHQLVVSSASLEESQYGPMVEVVMKHVRAFRTSELGQTILAAAESRTEFSVSTVFGEDYLTGTIDRIYKNDHGLWCLIDYKTDNIPPESLESRASHHKPQLLFYALLIQRLYGQEPVPATLFFLRHPSSPYHFTFTSTTLADFQLEVAAVIQEIKEGNFSRNTTICSSCSFQKNGRCVIPK